MLRATSFTFGTYKVDAARSTIAFTYRVEFQGGKVRTYTDHLLLKDVEPKLWSTIPAAVLEPTLQALLLMLGINYWAVSPTKNICIEGFVLTREQATFWDSVYLNGLGEFFYDMQMDFRGLIKFPYDVSLTAPPPVMLERAAAPPRALLLNGAGKDSILSAEMLKASGTPFDFFAFAPTPAHKRVASLVGAKTVSVTRRRDLRLEVRMSLLGISNAYPSVSTFTFVATLLAELLGYDSIIFSNERSADFGNLTYLGLPVNHQWCKSSEAEKLVNDYIQRYITPDISTRSLLREFSELEIVRRFVRYPKYLRHVTSCNSYFWLPRPVQLLLHKGYWCKRCPKCVFLFACFTAFLPREEVVKIFGADLYTHKRLLPLFKRILGIEGFKPLDCVGEPEEMILAMHYAAERGEYAGSPAMQLFEEHFPPTYDFDTLMQKVFTEEESESRMTREEALAQNPASLAPQEVVDSQEVLEVEYLGFDDARHLGQVVVARTVVEDVQKFFAAALAMRFPIEKVIPISHEKYRWNDEVSCDDNNSSGYNYRLIYGTNRVSKHAAGRAFDINPVQNPYVGSDGEGKETFRFPKNSVYDENAKGALTTDHPLVVLMRSLGWEWGGDWTPESGRVDYQHFEKNL